MLCHVLCCAQAALEGADLVIHTAGPFQRCRHHNVLEAAIAAKVPYIDVCDDTEYSEKWVLCCVLRCAL